jgi:glycosyltransferase involved in cell wall biosynthesis
MKKNKLPEISVIISTYNHDKWLVRCIRSLINQNNIKEDDFEIVLIDDFSRDKTQETIKKIKNNVNLVSIINKKNLGLPSSLNKAIKKSIGRYIVRVDSDDYVHRDFLYFLKFFLNENRHYHAVACDYVKVDKEEIVINRFNSRTDEIACGVMYRRECLYEIGLFNTKFKMREGHEMHKRFKLKFSIGHLELPLYKYRQHNTNRTKNKKNLTIYDKRIKKN